MIVFFDIGHGGRVVNGHFNQDPGATFESLREVDLVEAYVSKARSVLRAQGVSSVVLSYGPYYQRQAYANSIALKYPEERFLYLACHVNASDPPGDYALLLHDRRSKKGKTLAEAVGAFFQAKVLATTTEDWTKNAHETIDGIYSGPNNIAGLCFEPFFINHPSSAEKCTEAGLQALGNQLATAILLLE